VPIPRNVGDFRLMDWRVVDAIKLLPERTRFMKGIFAWVGFKTATVYYERPDRAAGNTKWHYLKLWSLALDGIVSFSTKPLKLWSYIGAICAMAAFSYLVYIVVRTLIYGVDVPGYASLLSIVLFFNGLIMVSIGVIGEYIARIFAEVKGRPLYLVRERVGFEDVPDEQ
jgi:polyisoprenyl-phosphate glycosyltransferase